MPGLSAVALSASHFPSGTVSTVPAFSDSCGLPEEITAIIKKSLEK
jgi:hypothetical protein